MLSQETRAETEGFSVSLCSVSPLTTDGLRFSHQLGVGVGRRREWWWQVCSAPQPPQPLILIDDQEEQEWTGWGHLPGGPGTSSFILRHSGEGRESQLHPHDDYFSPTSSRNRVESWGWLWSWRKQASPLTCILHAFLSLVNLQVWRSSLVSREPGWSSWKAAKEWSLSLLKATFTIPACPWLSSPNREMGAWGSKIPELVHSQTRTGSPACWSHVLPSYWA